MLWLRIAVTVLSATFTTSAFSQTAWVDDEKTLLERANRGDAERWGALSFVAPAGKQFCSLTLRGDLASDANDTDDEGFHIVNAASEYLDFEWWVAGSSSVYQPGRMQGSATVRWIDKAASVSDRQTAFCTDLPLPELPRHSSPMPPEPRSAPLPPSKPLLYQSPIEVFDEFRGWNDGYAERKFFFGAQEGYKLCRLGVSVRTRNPNDQPPERSGAGYALIAASDTYIGWQAWVEQDGHLWGPGRWMHVEFTVLWIRANATIGERIDSLCLTTIPPAQPIHQLPPDVNERERKRAGTAPNPTPTNHYWTVDRYTCRDRYDGSEDTLYDLSQSSNLSCQAARDALERLEASRDLCEFPLDGSHDNIHRFSRKEKISTNSCP